MLRKELPRRVEESVVEELTRDLSRASPDELADRIPVPHA
jgi:protein required for attachment to host cells